MDEFERRRDEEKAEKAAQKKKDEMDSSDEEEDVQVILYKFSFSHFEISLPHSRNFRALLPRLKHAEITGSFNSYGDLIQEFEWVDKNLNSFRVQNHLETRLHSWNRHHNCCKRARYFSIRL